jgi:hypothetical protein
MQKKLSTKMRIFASLFAFLFLVGAIVQWNDPDPYLWIAAYVVASSLSVAALLGHVVILPNAVAAIVFGVWFVSIAASLLGAPSEAFTSFKMQAASHEEPREAVGLVLLSGWSATLAIKGVRVKEKI